MLAGRELGQLLYPLVVLAITELPRFWYLTVGRMVPSLVVLVVVALGGADVKERVTARAVADAGAAARRRSA